MVDVLSFWHFFYCSQVKKNIYLFNGINLFNIYIVFISSAISTNLNSLKIISSLTFSLTLLWSTFCFLTGEQE